MPSDFDGLRQKSRSISGGVRKYQSGLQAGQSQTWTTNSSNDFPGRQVTLSEGHPWHSRQRVHGDIGGPFRTTRYYVSDSPTDPKTDPKGGGGPKSWNQLPAKRVYSGNWGYRGVSGNYLTAYGHDGPLLPYSSLNMASYWKNQDDQFSSEQKLRALGTTAIARCKPTNPAADLSVGLAELFREGLPSLPGHQSWKDRSASAHNAGSEYLNYVFGWQPLVSEVSDVISAAKRQEAIWKQYQRDAGRVVRRRFEFPVEMTNDIIYKGSNHAPNPVLNTYIMSVPRGDLEIQRTVEKRRWFEGAFSYYLPSGRDGETFSRWLHAIRKAKAVYGLTLTPEVLWNLAPWSWAADWFANTGDVISNISDLQTDGLVMRYGYIMESVREVHTFTLTGCRAVKGDDISSLQMFWVRETKTRLKASPYGFGLTWEGFSPRQLAILAALGVTRGR